MYRPRLVSVWTLEALIAVSGLSLLMGMGVSASEGLEQWYWRNPSPNGNDLNGVAYGNGTFVAVGAGGTILTSADGNLWEHRESGFDNQLNQVIFAQNSFLAVGEGGVILSSDNAKDWVSHPTDPLYSLRGVTFAQGKYVMVGANGDSQQLSQIILCSDDLVQWTIRQFPATHSLSQVAYGNGMFMAIGADSSGFAKATILVSSNGLDWNAVVRDDIFGLKSVAFGNGMFVTAGNGGGILTTADGTDWQDRSIGGVLPLLGVSWVDNQFLMVGGGRDSPILLSSPDGMSWAERDSAAGDWLYAVAGGGGRYVAVGQDGQIVSSADASTWSNETTYQFGNPLRGWLSAVAFGNGRFVAVGSEWIVTSTDGKVWTSADTTPPGLLTDVIFGGGRFLAVGIDGNILWSSDGRISWESTAVAPEIQLNSAPYGNGIYLVNGVSGTISNPHSWLLRSTNLTEWETVYGSTIVVPERIVYGNGRFVAGAPRQFLALVSTNGREWTEVSTGSVGISDMVFVDGKFVAIEGRSTNGLDWTFNSPQDRLVASDNYLSDITYGDGVFVALKSRGFDYIDGDPNSTLLDVLVPGSIWTSANGVQWTKRIDASLTLLGAAYGNRTFVAVGGHTAIVQSVNLASLVPVRLSGTLAADHMLSLNITSAAGLVMTVEISSDLKSWQALRTLVNESGQTNLLETILPTNGQRFYRAKTSN